MQRQPEEAPLGRQQEEPRFQRLQRVLVAQQYASEKPFRAVCLARNDDGTYRVGLVLPIAPRRTVCRVADNVPEETLSEAMRYQPGDRVRVQREDGSCVYGIVEEAQLPTAEASGAHDDDAAASDAAQAQQEPQASCVAPRYALDADGFVAGGSYTVRPSEGEGPHEAGIQEAQISKVVTLPRDTLVCVELGAERFWALVAEEQSVGIYRVARTLDGEYVRGVDVMCITEVEPFKVGQQVKVMFPDSSKFFGVVMEETSPGIYTVQRNLDKEEVEFCDGCAMALLREPRVMVETAEQVASELLLVADDVRRRVEEDDLLPSIGDRGAERRTFLRGQVDALAAEASRLDRDSRELGERAVEAEYLADEAARALLPPEPPEGEAAAQPQEEVPFEMLSPKEQEEARRLAAELLEKQEEANRLSAIAKRLRKCARRSEKASASAEKCASEVREAAEATESEVQKRQAAAARKAALWEKARSEEAACAVVWLHGQGESEVAWQTTLAGVHLPEELGACRWVWPRAPLQPCSTRGGVLTPQWFDTPEFPKTRVVRGVPDRPTMEEAPTDLTEATRRIHAIIEALEVEGLPSERIVLAGFGQGAALVPHAVLRFQRPLAGGAMLCAWVPCREALGVAAELAAPPEGRPSPPEFLWCAGARDAVVDPIYASEQASWLKDIGANVDFRMFPELAFGVNHELLAVLQEWLVHRLLPADGPPSEPADAEGDGGARDDEAAGQDGSEEQLPEGEDRQAAPLQAVSVAA